AVSLGVAIAANVIDNTIEAFITGANSGLTAVSGDINVHAADESTIESKSVAASLSVAVGQIGVALAGAGAIAENVIGNEVNAYIEGGSIVEAAARFNYLSDDVLTGTVASPPRIVQNQRVLIVADLDDGPVDPRAGQIYQYIGEDDLLPDDPAIPLIRLDEAIYTVRAVLKAAPPNPGDTDDAANCDFVPLWRLLDFGAHQSVNVLAENNATIDTLVGGAAGAVAGGMGAVAGSIGVAIGRNLIGTGSALGQETNAYVENSEVIASGDISVHAAAEETVEADVFAGSVAVAIGIGGAIAGAGAELHNLVSSGVQAFARNADLGAMGDIDVIATSSTDITRAEALGVAVSGGLVGFSVAVSVVENTITNDVDAFVSSTGDAEEISAGGKLTVLADVEAARITAAAETASVSVGAVSGSGGGIDIQNTVANTVDAKLSGTLLVATEGGVEVKADESSYLSGEALSVAASFGLGVAVGAAIVNNTADSDIVAAINNGVDVETLGDVGVLANSVV